MKRRHFKAATYPSAIKIRKILLVLLIVMMVTVMGCAKKIPHSLVPEYEKKNIKIVAILPVVDKVGQPELSVLLRQRIIEAFYFKGYPKISTQAIDDRLAVFYKNVKEPTVIAVPPRDVGGLLGVDAVLYTTITNCKTSFLYLYAKTSVSANFEMYNVRTGERLWSTSYQVSESNVDITRDRLRMKSTQVFESALQRIVNKAMETLPDGPAA